MLFESLSETFDRRPYCDLMSTTYIASLRDGLNSLVRGDWCRCQHAHVETPTTVTGYRIYVVANVGFQMPVKTFGVRKATAVMIASAGQNERIRKGGESAVHMTPTIVLEMRSPIPFTLASTPNPVLLTSIGTMSAAIARSRDC
jgi:hypothetical protein